VDTQAEDERSGCGGDILVASRGRRDAERHQRLPREEAPRLRGAGGLRLGPGGGGERGRGHGDGVPPVQGGHRDVLEAAGRGGGGVHRGGAGAGELRLAGAADRRGGACGAGDPGSDAGYQWRRGRRRRLDNRRGGHRCAVASSSAEAGGEAGAAGDREGRRDLEQRLGGHLRRVLDGEPGGLWEGGGVGGEDAPERRDLRAVPGDGPGDGGGDRQRHGRGGDDEGDQWEHRLRPPPRQADRHPEEISPPS